jgi:hypothetical protein
MKKTTGCSQDVMQVCRNGHIITDRLTSCPEQGSSHCDRCGAPTIDHCLTCGQPLPGAVQVTGIVSLGGRRLPQHCAACGASFPWTQPARPAPVPDALAALETLLRRLPRVIRQLRVRHGDRPAFRVEDEHDLEDLLRCLLPLHFDTVRPESRTPSYAVDTRTDFFLADEGVVVTARRVRSAEQGPALLKQLQEDIGYYLGRPSCRGLVCLVYDPEGLLREPLLLEVAWSKPHERLGVRCVIAS